VFECLIAGATTQRKYRYIRFALRANILQGFSKVNEMHVFSVLFQLHLPSTSLKGKRGIVKSLLARARNGFNVAAAEVDLQDMPGTAVLAFVTVGENKAQARRLLERLEEWLVEERPDVELVAVEIEER